MTHRPLIAAALALTAACNAPANLSAATETPVAAAPATASADAVAARLAAIERRTGGRLGVALMDAGGRLIVGHRAGERFAMCSTFKLPLAAMALDGAEDGRWRLGETLRVTQADILNHSPVAERHVADGAITIEEAAAAVVLVSDNGAANLLLRRMGGPAAFTAWLRAAGDGETRLDREELALNENAPGDPRDTTTPRASAAFTARLLTGDLLSPDSRALLRRWTVETNTGARRIRAGLSQGWEAGDKTGSCGTAWNDVAWVRARAGQFYALSVYLDRPTEVRGAEAEAVLAEVARETAALMR